MFQPPRPPLKDSYKRYARTRVGDGWSQDHPSGKVGFVIGLALAADFLVVFAAPVWVWVLVLGVYLLLMAPEALPGVPEKAPALATAWALLWIGASAGGVAYLLWRDWPSRGVGLGAAFGLGVGVGATAALVRVVIFYTRFRPPIGPVTGSIRMSTYLLSGAVAGWFVEGGSASTLVWVGSLIGGLISVLFPRYLPPEAKEEEDAVAACLSADEPALVGFLDSPFAEVRGFAVSRLRRNGWKKALPVFVKRLDVEQDDEVRRSIALALAEWAEPETHEPLRRLLSDGDEQVRRFALRGISSLGDPDAVGVAKSMYGAGSLIDRYEAIAALHRLNTPEAIEALRKLLEAEPSRRRRRQAKAGLRRMERRRARDKSL